MSHYHTCEQCGLTVACTNVSCTEGPLCPDCEAIDHEPEYDQEEEQIP